MTEIPQGYALGYSGVQNFQDVNLSNGAQVDVSGARGGDIQVQGRKINLTSNAAILSTTLGAGAGGNLTVDAAESVNLSDNASLTTYTLSTGSAGNLTITTRNLTVESGAFIQTPSTGQGQGGDLLVRASNAVELSGTTTDGQPSGLSAQVAPNATGKGGNLTIETGQLTIRDGATVDASTFGTPPAGNVRVRASDIELEGFATTPKPVPSGIFAQVADQAIDNAGNAGTLTIETGRLTVKNGAQIATTARKSGNGGDLTINASDSIKLSGALPNATPDRGSSGIFVSANSVNSLLPTGDVGNLRITSGQITVENGAKIAARNEGTGQGGTLTVNNAESVNVIGKVTIGSTPVYSTLSAAATASGKAGDLTITTRSLKVQDGAEVSVSGTSTGSSGKLTITANDLRLNQGKLTAETNAGEGANISLQNLDLLLLQNQSLISARAFNNAKGGNINIEAAKGVLAAVPDQNNDIIANASQGQGGKINITTGGIFGIAQRKSTPPNTTNDIDASSDFGLAGTVTINTPDVDPGRNLFTLTTGVVDASRQVASGCAAFADSESNSFTVTGRGGLPPSPDEPLSSDVVWSDTRLPTTTGQQHGTAKPTAKPLLKSKTVAIVPATGWVFNGKGEVTLISSAPNATSLGSTPASCPRR